MRLRNVVVGGLFAGLLVGATPAIAQIGVGPIGGVSFSNLTGSEADDFGPGRSGSTGFLAGVMLDFPLGVVSIRPEVFYVQKGVKFSDQTFAAEFSVDYIEIPVLLVFGIPVGSLKVEFFGGPQIAFQTKCEVTGAATGDPEETLPCDDPNIAFESVTTDYGVIIGGGVVVGSFMAQVALDYSLQTLDADPDPWDIRNQAIYVVVGWMFRLN